MIKKSLFTVLIFFISGCAGTIKIAEESGVNSKDLTTPIHRNSILAKPKD